MLAKVTEIPFTEQRGAALLLLWSVIGLALIVVAWPRGRGLRLARQIVALGVLGFREGLRLKMLWTVAAIAFIPGVLAYFSDADGTHAGRARLILNVCLTCGEVLGAVMIVLMASLSVAREIESRVMHTLGTKPVPRWGILFGKALGFWAIDVLFLCGLVLFTGVLVRMVPLRPESREPNQLVTSGTWEDLRRNALVTRTMTNVATSGGDAVHKFIKPGATLEQKFQIAGAADGEPLAVRFVLSSTWMMDAHIRDLGIRVGYEGEPAIYQKTALVPQDRPFEIFLDAKDVSKPGTLVVSLRANDSEKHNPSVIVAVPSGVQVGTIADGFSENLAKALLLMALQGWILALIMTGWSGVLSFPVAVALGLILVLGGEMSRHAVELMETSNAIGERAGTGGGASGLSELLRGILALLPDFRAAGGPAGFVEGTVLSAWAIAHAGFWMGVVRGIGWALPGIFMFQAREVGR